MVQPLPIALGQGGAQPNISQAILKNYELPCPPLPEQAEIVRRVELLFARVDALERQYATAVKSFDSLTPALLQKAFRGELVPQDPNDEPAAVLLERIRAQQAAQGPRKRGRGVGRKAADKKAAEAQDQGKAAADAEAKPKKQPGRPRKVANKSEIPAAVSYEDAMQQLEAMGMERASGTRQTPLFGDED
ncbi:hypothetical protein GCM10017783_23720 [Deinococcus piscis]|uniref:Type I restriction modification DNA specificity domain-containing protein n=1 Tax=Deinococcus piscis TaxID=394230 RepID=A0ABQ3KC12_9DEIO|nr:restriction endonuclease subunit S [Deinococcus piscis]GHG10521.1 hypothetical protein GCM10017783_23720 [Deinococcus piscis]